MIGPEKWSTLASVRVIGASKYESVAQEEQSQTKNEQTGEVSAIRISHTM